MKTKKNNQNEDKVKEIYDYNFNVESPSYKYNNIKTLPVLDGVTASNLREIFNYYFEEYFLPYLTKYPLRDVDENTIIPFQSQSEDDSKPIFFSEIFRNKYKNWREILEEHFYIQLNGNDFYADGSAAVFNSMELAKYQTQKWMLFNNMIDNIKYLDELGMIHPRFRSENADLFEASNWGLI